MKITKYLFLLLACLLVSGCDDDKKEPVKPTPTEDRPDVLAWIEDTMRENYYWYKDIPASLNYESDEETFFYSLLSTKDGKKATGGNPYSYIENTAGRTRSFIQEYYSYGIEFRGIFLTKTQIAALVLYVVPDSPAEDAGLERGDWIIQMDGKYITTNEMFASLQGGPKRTLTVVNWSSTAVNPENRITVGNITFVNKREVSIEPATTVVDNPVYLYKTIERGGKTVGYLLYNHFANGTDDDSQKYDNELRTVSKTFKDAGVNEVILDLRYNNGGALSSAILLCELLAPNTVNSNTTLGYLKYNDKQKTQDYEFTFGDYPISPGANLNLQRLYVLTSSSTASASEMVINSLSPFMDVIVIGDQTTGKNVGSVTYPNDNDPYPYGTTTWEMHPIVCQISNSDGFTDYATGFVPGTYNKTHQKTPVSEVGYIDEAFDFETADDGETYAYLTETLPLGDENERMLKVALQMIDGTYTRSIAAPATQGQKFVKLPGSSIDRKASGAVTIDIR